MEGFKLFSDPWWVNLLILGPVLGYLIWDNRLNLSKQKLFLTGIFGAAFGFVEASVVVYLRGAAGILSDCKMRLPDGVITFDLYRQSHLLTELPQNFLAIEMYREFATIIMLVAVALLVEKFWHERWAIFIWAFAFWDLFYYLGLKLTIDWPAKFTTSDVLFLLPVPWLSQVWFPILISCAFVFAIYFSRKRAGVVDKDEEIL